MESINISGLDITKEQLAECLSLDKEFLKNEVEEIKTYIDENVNQSAPEEIFKQIENFKQRVEQM